MCKGCMFFGVVLLCRALVANAETAKLEGVINLNTATPEELGLLSGIGPTRIRNILAYRKEHPFRTVEELARIKGIGRKTIRRMRLHLAVSGPTTIQKVLRPFAPASAQSKDQPLMTSSASLVSEKRSMKAEVKPPRKANIVPNKGTIVTGSRFLGIGNHSLSAP